MREDSWFRGALLSVLFFGGVALLAATPINAQFPGGEGPATGPGECPPGQEWSDEAGGCIPSKPPCPEGEVFPGCGQPPPPPGGGGGGNPPEPEPEPEEDPCQSFLSFVEHAGNLVDNACPVLDNIDPDRPGIVGTRVSLPPDCVRALSALLDAIRALAMCRAG